VANEAINLAPLKEASSNVQVKVAARHGVNNVFWEHFLTERPCCSNNEEIMSNYRAIPYSGQEEGQLVHGISSNIKNTNNLTL